MQTLLIKFLTRALLPMLFGLVGAFAGNSCAPTAQPPKAPTLAPAPAPGNTYVEVSKDLHNWQPKSVQWLQEAADKWCSAGLECAIVYVEGEVQPDGRIIRAVLEEHAPYEGALGSSSAHRNWLRIWRDVPWVMPDDPRCADGTFSGGYRIDATLAHELGHTLGMQHVCDRGECTSEHLQYVMHPSGSACRYGAVTQEGQP